MKFFHYLNLINGHSKSTCVIYCKYAQELIDNDLDYYQVLIKHKNASNNTKRVIISAMKKYYEFINDERKNQLRLPKKDRNMQEHISYREYKRLCRYLEKQTDEHSYITLLVVNLLFETGIRSSELLSIKKEDIAKNKILINGKNNKQRIVYLSNSLYKKVQEYIENKSGYIFKFQYKQLYKKISTLGKVVLNKRISPHMFRRGFATFCSKNNIDIYDICLLMGHENINTTKLYIKKEINKNFFKLFEN